MVTSEKNLPGTSRKKRKGKVLIKGLIVIFALKAIQNFEAGFKIKSYEKTSYLDCGCVGSILRFFETQF